MGADIRIVDMGIDEDPEVYLQEEAKKSAKKGVQPHRVRAKDVLLSTCSLPPMQNVFSKCKSK